MLVEADKGYPFVLPAEVPPPAGKTVMLLTWEGTAVKGRWDEGCCAWAPLPSESASVKAARQEYWSRGKNMSSDKSAPVPTGDEFRDVANRLGNLVAEKNQAYGNSYEVSARIMGLLYPDGIRPEQYRDALGVVRVLDKLCRLADEPDAFGENPWMDIAGYGLRGACRG